eukprot:15481937-Alexandrium_andersonii.AAC.1
MTPGSSEPVCVLGSSAAAWRESYRNMSTAMSSIQWQLPSCYCYAARGPECARSCSEPRRSVPEQQSLR